MATKKFHVGDVLSITTGRLVSPRHIDGVYDILNFMTGDNLFTHQLPRALNECRPHLLEQLPQLKATDASGVTSENLQKWLDEQVVRFGEQLTVHDIPEGRHEFRNPLDEAAELRGGADKVIPVVID
jgi:hypothetical protein